LIQKEEKEQKYCFPPKPENNALINDKPIKVIKAIKQIKEIKEGKE
jgi:hypothetical protein